MRRLIRGHVVVISELEDIEGSSVELFRYPGLDAGGESALVQLQLGTIEGHAQQRIAELVGVARIEIHIIGAIRQMFALVPQDSHAIVPSQRGLLPLRSPPCRRLARRNRAETGD